MTTVLTSQYTTPNLTVDAANGTAYVYRRYRKASTVPVIFFQHFRGNLDNWDPALLDDIADEREVILFDAAGVGLSSGTVPTSFAAFGRDALAFIDALGLTEVDLFGFSIGGFVAQEVALQRPHLVRRMILAGNRTPGWSGNARLDRRSPRPRHEGHPRGGGHPVPLLRRVADESGEGHAVRRSDLHPKPKAGTPFLISPSVTHRPRPSSNGEYATSVDSPVSPASRRRPWSPTAPTIS
jgi:pimeloyl-ACP methyl ester carboxylesterase